MPSQRQLKTRIRSVKNTKQITKAMQMVAASKMRRTQEATKASSPYADAANKLLAHLAGQGDVAKHRWFSGRPIKNRLIIVISSDKGLAGAYDSNVLKSYLNLLQSDDQAGVGNKTITIGRKASHLASKLHGVEIVGAYDGLPDSPGETEVYAILGTARDMFESGAVDAVDVLYTRFISSMSQVADSLRLFPAGLVKPESLEEMRAAIFEPSTEEVIESVAYRLIASRIYQTLLDAKASEYSMRMLAMKNATDNAGEIVNHLTLEMNKARQAAITQEISEISAGVEAMK